MSTDTHTHCCRNHAEAEQEPAAHHAHEGASCHAHDTEQGRIDWLLWGSLSFVLLLYGLHLLPAGWLPPGGALQGMAASAHEILNMMLWGIVLAIVFVGLLSHIPREFVLSLLGRGGTAGGIVRATGAGVLLDLCSHGILAVGMKLYERGASIGQVMAFLLASPWNSLSLTIILVSIVGLSWTLAFIALSAVIAMLTGYCFDRLVRAGTLPANPHTVTMTEGFRFLPEARRSLATTRFDRHFLAVTVREGLSGSRMVLRWLFFGMVLAVLIRAVLDVHHFQAWFGPTLAGLLATMLAATVIEVCSEGSVPIAGDLFQRAGAPGNAFAFLMAGVSTDYTEIMSVQNTTGSWRIALFLPLVSLPQIILVAILLN